MYICICIYARAPPTENKNILKLLFFAVFFFPKGFSSFPNGQEGAHMCLRGVLLVHIGITNFKEKKYLRKETTLTCINQQNKKPKENKQRNFF